MTGKAKERAVLVCPGRGTYGREELGYLAHYHRDKTAFLGDIDAYRRAVARDGVTDLDGRASYSPSVHGAGCNASALIYACALCDAADLDLDRFDIVAVTGNSLGWYLALAAAGALSPERAIHLIDTMGHLMDSHGGGGQVLYPIVDEAWRPSRQRQQDLKDAMAAAQEATGEALYTSIELGGYRVIAGALAALDHLLEHLPPIEERFPLRLARHAAFHTPLLAGVAAMAQSQLGPDVFQAPALPLIDGRGAIWRPLATDLASLRDYTLGAQITTTYDFTRAIRVALKEFAPDRLILTGPGQSLGPPVAQTVLDLGWWGVRDRADVSALQSADPRILSFGTAQHRSHLTRRL